jgi:hypothetical protein
MVSKDSHELIKAKQGLLDALKKKSFKKKVLRALETKLQPPECHRSSNSLITGKFSNIDSVECKSGMS